MRIALIVLSLTYILSQFYRAFLAVLAADLEADIGATAVDLSQASGAWFLVFALAQIPVGWALDTVGPRKSTALLVFFGAGGGAILFAMAQAPWHLTVAMGLIGIGCAPILMASFFLIARNYAATAFSIYAGFVIGTGNIGNVGAALPMTYLVELIGWRGAMVALGLITLVSALAIYAFVKDPPKVSNPDGGNVLSLLKIPALWLIFPLIFVNYAPAAGARGLWIGPYFTDTFAATDTQVGLATLVMGLAMVVGSVMYGPLERLLGTRKWVVFGGALTGASLCLALGLIGDFGFWTTAVIFAGIGIGGTTFPVIVGHARSFIPNHLMGRGITLINLLGIGGVGVMQFITGQVFDSVQASTGSTAPAFSAVFLTLGLAVCTGLAIYAFCQDRTD